MASKTKDTDLVDDLFGELNEEDADDLNDIDDIVKGLDEDTTVDKVTDDKVEDIDKDNPDTTVDKDKDSEPEIDFTPQKKTNLKKNMERSFEDLLNGLSDDSDPELEDIVPDDIDNTNLEKKGNNSNNKNQSLLGSPDKSYPDIKADTLQFTSKQFDATHDMDVVSSTPKSQRNAESPKVKVTPPEVKVQTPDDEEVEYDDSGDNNFANIDDDDDDNDNDNDEDVEMVTKTTRKSTLSSEDDVDLGVIEDTNHLDVDVSKHKSALGKKGSLALRRKQSRRSRKSLLSTGEDAIFQDSTEVKPEMMNGDDDDEDLFGNKDEDDGYDLSPPAKKHSPATMMPLPGMASKPPSQRSPVSRQDDDDEETNKEIKRKSKPPPGAFVLPAMGASPIKPRRPNSESSEKSVPESKSSVFEKPALRSVKPKERSRSPVEETTPFGRSGLKGADKSDVDMKSSSEEKDVTFQKPSLRSTPKPTNDQTSDKKVDTNAGTFEKPTLRNTPKPKLEQKSTEPVDQEDKFGTRNLRSVQKQDNNSIDRDSDIHTFDKPPLKSSKPRIDNTDDLFKNDSKSDAKTFEKPSLRSTNINSRSNSVENQGYEPSHSFEKPTLRTGNSRPSAVRKQDNFTAGTFEKPSLKKTTPSPEKEVKEINEPKGIFDRPPLRKTDSLKEREEKEKHSEKPSWLQKASDKQGRALDILQSKENQSNSDKQLPSWLEKSPLRKTRGTPLQDSSNNQSTNSSQSDLSTEDYGKSPSSTPRSRNSSGNEPERKTSISEKVGEDTSDIDELFDDLIDYDSDDEFDTDDDNDDDESSSSHNNYTPGWMRQTRSPSVPSTGGVSPAKSMPALSESNEIPQWKKELAQRRQNRKERTTEDHSQKEETKEPEWKRGIQLRKTRNTSHTSKETHSVEPEWKKKAEEKRQRLRNSVVDN